MRPPARNADVSPALIDGPRRRGIHEDGPPVPGQDLGPRFVEAMVRGDFEEMASILHPQVRFRGLSPHKFLKTSTKDPVGGVLRAFRIWFYEGAGADYQGDHPEQLLSCTAVSFGGGGRFKLSYRIRAKSREMAQIFRSEGLGEVPDDGHWLVEQEAYYDVLDGRIGWMIVLCGGYQPMISIPTAQGVPESSSRHIVL
jgi:hypothetical protein